MISSFNDDSIFIPMLAGVKHSKPKVQLKRVENSDGFKIESISPNKRDQSSIVINLSFCDDSMNVAALSGVKQLPPINELQSNKKELP